MSSSDVTLAATLSDPDGALLGRMGALGSLSTWFNDICVVATDQTDPREIELLRAAGEIEIVPANVAQAGAHRRRALGMALGHSADVILYADFDHVLRWSQRLPTELASLLALPTDADAVVIGRSDQALASTPRRLFATERIVNDLVRLATGFEWDTMMAARLMTRAAAEVVVSESTESTLATDVEWPLLLSRRGFSVAYAAADGLTYETNPTFGLDEFDTGDTDVGAWLFRLELAALHLRALQAHLRASES